MRKLFLLLLTGLIMCPTFVSANSYKSKNNDPSNQIPTRTSNASYVTISLNETTGLLTMYFIGNVGNVEMTISQNGTVIDYDCFAGSNGGTETYSFASYAVGEYLLTLETESGSVSQYIITVEDD